VNVPAEIFRAYDIRGIVGKTLTPAVVFEVGRALGALGRERGAATFAVGRDGRLSGPALATALMDGLNAAGAGVVELGMVPTPVAYFAAHHLGCASAVMVTGSHNPPAYNGLKMVVAGDTLFGEAIQALRRRIDAGAPDSVPGKRTSENLLDAYVERIAGDVKLARPFRIAMDCGNGVAGAVAPRLFRRLGCQVEELFCEVDGNFPNHHPDPSRPENLKDLVAALAKGESELGLAFDGDGDRLGVVTKSGKIIYPDRQLMLYAKDVLARNPGAEIIYDVKCTRLLAPWIVRHGGRPVIWKTGHSFIKAKLKESGAPLAGEMSGHIFFKERWYGFDDGLYTAARLLELLSRDPRTTQEIFASLPNTVNTPELNLKFAEGEHFTVIKELVQRARFPDAKLTTIDGLRADFPDGFGLVRASNTTPVLVLRFEADNQAALERIQNRFRELILSVRPGIALPF
jgi:phosphomannomutase/phosphoglucomutase